MQTLRKALSHYIAVHNILVLFCEWSFIILWPSMVLQQNLVSGCTLILPFSVPNFKAIRLCFCSNFHTLTKRGRKKKTKELSQLSKVHTYLWKRQAQFRWNLKCEVMTLAGISNANIVNFVKVSRSYAYILLIVLPVNNSWLWRVASWATQHTTVCLDIFIW